MSHGEVPDGVVSQLHNIVQLDLDVSTRQRALGRPVLGALDLAKGGRVSGWREGEEGGEREGEGLPSPAPPGW